MPMHLRPIYNVDDPLACRALRRHLAHIAPGEAVSAIDHDPETGDATHVHVRIGGYAGGVLRSARVIRPLAMPGNPSTLDLTVADEITVSAPIARLPQLLAQLTYLNVIIADEMNLRLGSMFDGKPAPSSSSSPSGRVSP